MIRALLALPVLSMLTVGAAAQTAPVSGDYIAVEEPSVGLTLQESAAGEVSGALRQAGESVPLVARRNSAGFSGLVGVPGQQLPVSAVIDGDRIVLNVGGDDEGVEITFVPAARVASGGALSGTDRVVINGQVLSSADLDAIEDQYGVRIRGAEYWYDATVGAWGLAGGPTIGFTAPGLTLGGALRADASGGGTLVFVNGRALHPIDLLRLQALTGPIPPGRYFIRADGFAGYEGGPPQWNLFAMAEQAGGGGGSNTWQSSLTGASGFSDGTTGAVFLPDGGIVSTGN